MSVDRPPGPRGHPVLGNLPAFGADPLGTLLDGWQRFGDVVRFRGPVPPADLYLAVNPRHVDDVLGKALEYPHTAGFDARFGASGGHGIITQEGEAWLAERRVLEPVLAPPTVASLVPGLARAAVSELERVLAPGADDAVVDLQPVMAALSLRMLGSCLFGPAWDRYGGTLGRSLSVFIAHVGAKLSSPVNIPEALPTRRNRRFLAARQEYDRAIAAVLDDHRRRSPEERSGVLDGFLAAQEALGRQGDARWLRDQLTNHFAAGHATVQAALSWTCHLLGTHTDVQQAVRGEVHQVLVSAVPTHEELQRLRTTTAVLKESMRLFPPLSLQPRSPTSDTRLDGCRIPAGSPLFISSYLTHRHPEHWEAAETFAPERFADGERGLAPGAYWPFSVGPRRCVGETLAMVEMQLALGLLLRRHRIVLAPRLPVRHRIGIVLEPEGGVPARLAMS